MKKEWPCCTLQVNVYYKIYFTPLIRLKSIILHQGWQYFLFFHTAQNYDTLIYFVQDNHISNFKSKFQIFKMNYSLKNATQLSTTKFCYLFQNKPEILMTKFPSQLKVLSDILCVKTNNCRLLCTMFSSPFAFRWKCVLLSGMYRQCEECLNMFFFACESTHYVALTCISLLERCATVEAS